MASTLDSARECFARGEWAAAHAGLSAADRDSPLEPEDLDRLVVAAHLLGHDQESIDLSARSYREWLAWDEPARAALRAFWLGFTLLLRGENARGGGWLARARRLLDENGLDCVAQGYLLVPEGLACLGAGEAAAALDRFERAAAIGARFTDPDLTLIARLGRGQALVLLGEIERGMALLDEVMIEATAGDASAMTVGFVYCAVIEACHDVFDIRRAREWTATLGRWCDTQPDLVLYRGVCLIHRSEIMVLCGAWPDAMDEARLACERLVRPPGHAAAGQAFYQLGELHRLRGAFDEAERAYQRAGRWIREPQPGLALLRLAQGRVDAAAAATRRALEAVTVRVTRARLLAAHTEIMLAAGDVSAARAAAAELRATAALFGGPWPLAMASHATASVLLGDGDGQAALEESRRAWTAWQEVDAPYEAARVRVAMGLAYRRLGDEEAAKLEFDAARWVFTELGAVPDLARVDALCGPEPRPTRSPDTSPDALTPRETEVLRLVATGKTNRAIAAHLFLSEKTVAHHVSNILGKLGLPSRSAATAYAYERDLVGAGDQDGRTG